MNASMVTSPFQMGGAELEPKTVTVQRTPALAVSTISTPNIAELVKNHHALVWRTLKRLGVPAADVDDATQSVFLTLSKRINDFDPAKVKSFLYGVAVRTAANERRSRKTRPESLTTVQTAATFETLVDPNLAPDMQLDRQRALCTLDRMLVELATDLREVFVLCEIEELTATEAAELLGVPTGTVASRLRRARETLAAAIVRLRTADKRMSRTQPETP